MVERSQPMPQTPPTSSKKEQVVRTGTPNYDALESLDTIIHSPLPGANSLSTLILTSQIAAQTKLLLDAVDLAQTQTSSSQTPVNENIPQQVTGSGVSIIANPPTTKEVTLQVVQVLPVSSSSGAATTSVELVYTWTLVSSVRLP